jgi:hypothetical protein
LGRRIGVLNIDEEVPQNMLPPHLNLPQNAQHAFNVCEDDDTFYDNRRNNCSPGPSPQGSQDDVYNNWQVLDNFYFTELHSFCVLFTFTHW